MKIAVLGAGAWGTGLAIQLAGAADVVLWTRNPEHAARIAEDGTNARYLPGYALTGLGVTSDLAEAIRAADYLVSAVPTSGFRDLLRQTRGVGTPLVWLCKGFENGTMKLPHQVVAEEWPEREDVAALSGPSFAQEVAAGQPAALTLAAFDGEFARRAAHDLHRPRLRLYSSSDLPGVEVGGAIKNVIAIAAGISDGLGFGLNARAALLTRGLAEISRLGLQLGGRQETFMGLSGMGDLILTCTGDLSRNRRVGLRLAQGESLEGILRELGHVAEGVTTAREVGRLAVKLGVEMPIVEAVRRILDQDLPPREAVAGLLNRELRDE
ncbi:NAD(P)-dependent glycerol-3-phosphate dehydrogenase [Parasulfuritortus cantonensis]|uniref:Glycerol-3-phosphate dehydrogenase [NAD(P)+] n=1 Tax=Parasulfuritortus cantonensis TaxID=2528202 RepID=A0A4R1B5S9_9PROT|nr:NAD(P)H-dependent glycerol-3-phosphate dehydrogenase [Parasulfuritortus cantonensis]TCJ12890.1 NAD(P)-dependent glycerol-3-phosphate dehydrogenase [Parasulfuritortus cantonensis]